MTFRELFENKKGTYVGIQWPKEVAETILETANEYNVPNLLDPSEIHTTVIYSRVGFNHTPSDEDFKFSTVGPNNSRKSMIEVFESQGKRILVIKLYSKQIIYRHNEIMTKNPTATYDFPEFIPHITLSYDIGDYDISNFDYEQYSERLEDASGGIEYVEDLDLNWNS